MNQRVGGVTIRWATVNLITRLCVDEPVLVAHAHPGLQVQIAVPADHRISGTDWHAHADELIATPTPGTAPIVIEAPTGERIHLVVLDPAEALRVWTPTVGQQRYLLLSEVDIVRRGDRLVALAEDTAAVAIFRPENRVWTQQVISGDGVSPVPLELVRRLPDGHPPRRTSNGRASAPTRDELAEHSARYRLRLDPIPTDVERAILVVDLVGDVADVAVAGHARPFDDLFWDGEPWTIDLTGFAGTGALELEIRLSAFDPEASIRLPPDADRTRRRPDAGAVVHAAELRLTRATTIAVTHPSAREA